MTSDDPNNGCEGDWGRGTNGCSRERRIPFPLFLRTNRMHVIVIGYANQIVSGEERCVTSDDPNNGCQGD